MLDVSQKDVIIIRSPARMLALGRHLAKSLEGGDVVLISGELGAGKTVFCKGLAEGLGVTSPVVSPTFTIMNEYSGRAHFCHFDAYRLENADEAYGAGLTDFIGAPDCICAVEWWENVRELFDGCSVVRVIVKKIDEKTREVTILK